MVQIKTLPLLPGAKFIIVDDGEAMRSQTLILGWLQMWNDKGLGNTVEVLLFSNPRFIYENFIKNYPNIDLKLHDCYTVSAMEEDKNDIARLERIADGNTLLVNSVVILDCLSSLIISVGLSKALHFVEKLNLRCAQIICIYRRDFCPMKIPRIETLGTTYVRLEKQHTHAHDRDNVRFEVLLNHRKQGGGILKYRGEICQELASSAYEIVEETIFNPTMPEICFVPSRIQEKPWSTFRIEMNAREQEQRKNTPLPYGMRTLVQNESQILYEPDKLDDLDEEDPDDDLPF